MRFERKSESRKTHPDEADALEPREVGGELEHRGVREVAAVCSAGKDGRESRALVQARRRGRREVEGDAQARSM